MEEKDICLKCSYRGNCPADLSKELTFSKKSMIVIKCDSFEPSGDTEFEKDKYPVVVLALIIMLIISTTAWAVLYLKL